MHVFAETDQNDVRLINAPARGGYGLDGVWSDDFHHAVHALSDRRARRLLSGFRRSDAPGQGHQPRLRLRRLLQSLSPPPPRHPRGRLDRTRFVVCVQNHDQVGNRARGIVWRASDAGRGSLGVRPAAAFAVRAAVVHGARNTAKRGPFRYFCSFGDADLVEAVRRGGARSSPPWPFAWGAEIPDPQAPKLLPRPSSPGHGRKARRRPNCANCTRICWPPAAAGPAPRPAAHGLPAVGRSRATDRADRPASVGDSRGGDRVPAVADLAAEARLAGRPELGGTRPALEHGIRRVTAEAGRATQFLGSDSSATNY